VVYRDELEAALARIAALEREVEDREELRRRCEREVMARQDAEAELQIARLEAEHAARSGEREREWALERLRDQFEIDRARWQAERAELEARVAAEEERHRATADHAIAAYATLREERDVLFELAPGPAAELYARRVAALSERVAAAEAELARHLEDGPDDTGLEVHRHVARALANARASLAEQLTEAHRREAEMRARAGRR